MINYEQHHFKNLSSPEPDWQLEYDFRQKYKLPPKSEPITTEEIDSIVKRIFDDEEAKKVYIGKVNHELEEVLGPKECQIFDDPTKFFSCSKETGFSSKLYRLLEFLRGAWSYRKHSDT